MNYIDLALKAAYPRALSTLIRVLGDFDLAEEAIQEATARAISVWPQRGVPDNPSAWLVRTGRNHTVDYFRRRDVERRHSDTVAAALQPGAQATDDDLMSAHFDDDLLRLIFTCCHPALPSEGQIALTLKTVAGLRVEEIASAFLVSPASMEKRLTRAKAKLRDDAIPYAVPTSEELPERLDAVLAVIYLIFNEGYAASGGSELTRMELCREALRLGRMITRAFRDHCEAGGLLALMLLQHSRSASRTSKDGAPIPLDEQDRSSWDPVMISEARTLVEKTLRRQRPGPYQVQAAIAALHAEAPSVSQTDWGQIAVLYAQLERYQPTPVVTLNRAVAVAKAEGPTAGLAILTSLATDPTMRRYHRFHAALGSLLLESGKFDEAKQAFDTALSLTDNERERTFLRQQRDSLH